MVTLITAKKQHPVGLDWQNNNFARASCYLSISLLSLHDYDEESEFKWVNSS